MKNLCLFLLLVYSSVFISCSTSVETNSDQSSDGLEIIKVDLSEAREGKLSEFFEPEIEYIWLKDDSEDAQLGGLNKVFFYDDKIFTLDIFGCKCIKIFDRKGEYFSKIRAYGEGPEKYLDFDDAIIVNNEVLLLGIYPPKLMWFSIDGEFLREEKLAKHVGSGIFLEEEKRYYFFKNVRELGNYFVESVNEDFKDTLKFFPYDVEGYYGDYPSRSSFMKNDEVYVGRPFNDTIMLLKSGKATPKFIFDFEKYAQQIDELKKKSQDLSPPDLMNFINNKSKLYFIPFSWHISDTQLYSSFKYETDSYNVFFDRKNQMPHIIDGRLKNDIDKSFDPFSFSHHFRKDKIGFYLRGKTLFKELQKKKAELGQEGFEEYVKGKGKNFAQVAFAAKDSENPVLIVYTVKK